MISSSPVVLRKIIWKDQFVEKFGRKHQVSAGEVEEVLDERPHIRRVEKGRVKAKISMLRTAKPARADT